MTIADVLRSIPGIVDKAASGVFRDVTYGVVSNSAAGAGYDSDSGSTTPALTDVLDPVRALISKFMSEEIDGQQIRATDQKVSIAGNELPAIVPTPGDLIRDSALAVLVVVSAPTDPVEAFWILHVRPWRKGWPTLNA